MRVKLLVIGKTDDNELSKLIQKFNKRLIDMSIFRLKQYQMSKNQKSLLKNNKKKKKANLSLVKFHRLTDYFYLMKMGSCLIQ